MFSKQKAGITAQHTHTNRLFKFRIIHDYKATFTDRQKKTQCVHLIRLSRPWSIRTRLINQIASLIVTILKDETKKKIRCVLSLNRVSLLQFQLNLHFSSLSLAREKKRRK